MISLTFYKNDLKDCFNTNKTLSNHRASSVWENKPVTIKLTGYQCPRTAAFLCFFFMFNNMYWFDTIVTRAIKHCISLSPTSCVVSILRTSGKYGSLLLSKVQSSQLPTHVVTKFCSWWTTDFPDYGYCFVLFVIMILTRLTQIRIQYDVTKYLV